MSRRVIGAKSLAMPEAAGASAPDDYLARLVKYVPAEIIALYLTAAGIVPANRSGVLWAVAAFCAVLTPVYLRWVTSRGGVPPLRQQIVIGTIAFPIWLFAIGGPFALLGWYAGYRFVASLVLLAATTIFPLFAPPPGS